MSEDKNLTCRKCGKEFLFSKGEQEFYQQKGLNLPTHCPECRQIRQINRKPLVCAKCKTELEKDTDIFCTACLASVYLESELALKQKQKAVEEVQSKLQKSEAQGDELKALLGEAQSKLQHSKSHNEELDTSLSEKTDLITTLESSLNDKERLLAELDKERHNISQELESVRQFHGDLQWIHPAMDRLQERLDSLEYGQNKINQRMVQIVEKMQEIYNRRGFLESIKRIFHSMGIEKF